MKRDTMVRPVMRRADAGVDTVSVNGGTPVSGPVDIESNMASMDVPGVIRIDNGNTKIGLVTNTITQADLDTEKFNSFYIDWEPGVVNFPPPKVPTAPNQHSLGRKITFTFVYEGVGNPADTIVFDATANGYQFALPNVSGGVGPFLTDFNALVAGIVAGGATKAFKIGFEYVGGGFAVLNAQWVCVALAGPF